MAFALLGLQAAAQVCAPPGSLGTLPNFGNVNTYYAGANNLAVGATSVVLGATGTGAATPFAIGDLMMIIQMQDADINQSNNNTYGDGSGSGAGAATVGRSGLFEFLRVTGVAGANITFTPPLTNSYINANATAATTQKRYQIVRAGQYSTLNASGITAPPWNGATGGVISVDVRGTLTLTSTPVEGLNSSFFVAGKGFRGGGSNQRGGGGSSRDDYATDSTLQYHGIKGEGIAGTPLTFTTLTTTFVAVPPGLVTTTTAPGYPGGSAARGAPGNAGGGGVDGRNPGTGNDENAGGGGGGNYGPGGNGGRPWNDPLYDTGGRGGAGYAGTLAFNRVFLGGGGGAGGSNDATSDNVTYPNNSGKACNSGAARCSSGAPGGGIVIIRARFITGAGPIEARGGHAYNVQNDAGGGGGAGGSVILQTVDGGNAVVIVPGGDGGNAWKGQAGGLPDRHGPGGAGGGGFVAYAPTSMSVAANIDGGAPGQTMSDLVNETYGSTGYNGGLTTFQVPNIPGVPQAALCDPNLSLIKTNGVTSLTSPGSTTYTLTVTNTGLGFTSGTVAIADLLPAGLSVAVGPLAVSGPNAGSWSCSASTTTNITCNSLSTIAGGGSSTFAFPVSVLAPNGTALVNQARVSGGADPLKTATIAIDASACTANGAPPGCAIDTDTVVAANLALTKTDNTTTVVTGGSLTYTLVVTNLGGTATSGTITIADLLPTGVTLVGSTTVGGFTCAQVTQTVTCNKTTALAASASATVSLIVTVDGTASSAITNLARVGGGGDPSINKSLTTALNVAACPAPTPPAANSSDVSNGCAGDTDAVNYVRLSLTKDDGATLIAQNGTTEYLFVVTNTGTAPSTGPIFVRDATTSTMTISATGTFSPIVPAGNPAWSCVANSVTDTLCTLASSIPAGGSVGFYLEVRAGNAAFPFNHINRAQVGGGGDARTGMPGTPTHAEVKDCITDGIPIGCAIDLNTVQNGVATIRMTKSHPDPQLRAVGGVIPFTLVVSNTGGATATAATVRVVDALPAGLTVSAVTSAAFTCGILPGALVSCTNTLQSITPGFSVSINFNATVTAVATNNLINRARASTTGIDPQNAALTTTLTATAVLCSGTDVPFFGCAVDPVPLAADLSIAKLQRIGTTSTFTSTTTVVPPGSTVQYQITVTNNGPSNVNTVTIADTVPVNFGSVTWVCGLLVGTGSCSAASGTGNAISLTGNLNGTPTASSLRITVTAVAAFATAASGVINEANVSVPLGISDTTPSNNTATVTTRVGLTNLSITKTDGTNTAIAGGSVTYTVVVNNTGTFAADGARIFDPVATGLSCTAAPTCVATGPATCPVSLTMADLQNTTPPQGVAIPTFGGGGTLTLTYTCSVTATGQ